MINWDINQEKGDPLNKKFLDDIIKFSFKVLKVKDAEVSIAIVSSYKIKKANETYRKKKGITDVLSFIYDEDPLSGEILICYDKIVSQAKQKGHSTKEELKTLLIHSLVHLAGYDHKNNKDEKMMKEKENIILKKISL
jgi:probable rRNA maturation factor